MTFLLQLAVTGFALGMIYALVAIGFVIILKCSNAFNLAQGHFVMIGGYLGYTFLVTFGLPIWATLILAIGVAVIMGLLIERLTLRPLMGQSDLAVIMMTIALFTVLEGLATLIWGGEYKTYHGLLPTLNFEAGSDINTPGVVNRTPGLFFLCNAAFASFPLYQDRTGHEGHGRGFAGGTERGYPGHHGLCRLLGHCLCRRGDRRHSFGRRIRSYDTHVRDRA